MYAYLQVTEECNLTADVQFELRRKAVCQCCYRLVPDVPLTCGWPSPPVTDHRRHSAVPCLLQDMHSGLGASLGAACAHAHANSQLVLSWVVHLESKIKYQVVITFQIDYRSYFLPGYW